MNGKRSNGKAGSSEGKKGKGVPSCYRYCGISGPAASLEARLTALAKQIAAERRVSFAQAYVEALNANPRLYVAYLREHEAALGVRRG